MQARDHGGLWISDRRQNGGPWRKQQELLSRTKSRNQKIESKKLAGAPLSHGYIALDLITSSGRAGSADTDKAAQLTASCDPSARWK